MFYTLIKHRFLTNQSPIYVIKTNIRIITIFDKRVKFRYLLFTSLR